MGPEKEGKDTICKVRHVSHVGHWLAALCLLIFPSYKSSMMVVDSGDPNVNSPIAA